MSNSAWKIQRMISTMRLVIPLVFLLPVVIHTMKNFNEREFAEAVQSYFEWAQNGTNLVLPLNVSFEEVFSTFKEGEGNRSVSCSACRTMVYQVIVTRKMGAPKELMVKAMVKLCETVTQQNRRVCNGIISTHADIFLFMMDNKDIQPATICAVVLEKHGCSSNELGNWEVKIPGKGYVPGRIPGRPTVYKILQLTDIHYDPKYKIGGNLACGEPACCQPDQGKPPKSGMSCKMWSNYKRSNIPMDFIKSTLNHIRDNHKDLNYIYITGDIVNYRIWDTTIKGNKHLIKTFYDEVYRFFPKMRVYPALGNHEPHPLNIWVPRNVRLLSTQWLLDFVAKEWEKWLPNLTKHTIRSGGCYTVEDKPGFRIIVLNSNVGYNFNWWLAYSDVDPFGILHWLTDTLLRAEKNGEIVHIISHIPSGDVTANKHWSIQYRRIVDRFAEIIAAEFNGHTHNDQFNLYFNTNGKKPMSVVFNGGSLVTYEDRNPNYKIYYIDGKNYEVIDMETYSFNLTKANIHRKIQWEKLYSFKDAFNLANLKPDTIYGLVGKLAKDRKLFNQYYSFLVRKADTAMAKGCDNKCFKENLCNIVSSKRDGWKQCHELFSHRKYCKEF